MTAGAQDDLLELAFRAALAARQETFLARLPRLLKLAVLALLLLAPGFFFLGTTRQDSPALTAEPPRIEEERTETPASSPVAEASLPAEPSAPSPAAQQPLSSPPSATGQPRSDLETGAINRNDLFAVQKPLPPAPDIALAEETKDGYLPKIGADGRKPWQVYARPFDKLDPRPRIALVVVDMGLSRVATDAALRRLPPVVTLAFDAQSDTLPAWLSRARQDGHETILSLPMEPFDYPRSDPGPDALLTSLPNADNLQRFLSFLKRGVGYVGVTTLSGSRFFSDGDKFAPVLQALGERGLLFFDARVGPRALSEVEAAKAKLPFVVSSMVVDQDPSPSAINANLAKLEQMARASGQVVALASPLPVTLERIEAWSKDLAARGFVLAPLSATVQDPKTR